jgi:SnoaL-like domain
MDDASAALLRELSDRQAIHDALMRYCRGVDRIDADLICSAYHPDAVDEHGPYRYSGVTVGPAITERLRPLTASLHMIGNELIEFVDSDTANVESYFTMWLVSQEDSAETVCHGFGRYLDRFGRRNGDWRIDHRVARLEWEQTIVDAQKSSTSPIWQTVMHD